MVPILDGVPFGVRALVISQYCKTIKDLGTTLSALARVEQGARYTYVTGGLTTPKHWHLLLTY